MSRIAISTTRAFAARSHAPARLATVRTQAFANSTGNVLPANTAAANTESMNFGNVGTPRVFPRFAIVVKGSPEKGELGDCPFSQRTMLTLEEKSIPYHKILVDEGNMPDWIGDVNPDGKKIPVILDLEQNKWIADSAKIVTYLEQEFPKPKFGTPETCTDVYEGLFPAYMEFLKSKGGEQQEKERALVGELRKIEEHIKSKGGPFLAGKEPCSACFALAPQLNHIRVGAKDIKGWEIPSEFSAIQGFQDAFRRRDSWQNTVSTDKYIADGWNVKLQKMGAK